MSLRQLRTFVAVVDAGGVARAAARLHLSQPAASRQIHALESDLGVTLFDRVGRRVQLTPEAEDLLPRCRRVLLEFESLGERARMLRKGEGGVLRIGATPQVIEGLLSPFLQRYRQRHPGTEVHLIEDGGVRLPRRLERSDVQLAVMPENEWLPAGVSCLSLRDGNATICDRSGTSFGNNRRMRHSHVVSISSTYDDEFVEAASDGLNCNSLDRD